MMWSFTFGASLGEFSSQVRVFISCAVLSFFHFICGFSQNNCIYNFKITVARLGRYCLGIILILFRYNLDITLLLAALIYFINAYMRQNNNILSD